MPPHDIHETKKNLLISGHEKSMSRKQVIHAIMVCDQCSGQCMEHFHSVHERQETFTLKSSHLAFVGCYVIPYEIFDFKISDGKITPAWKAMSLARAIVPKV